MKYKTFISKVGKKNSDLFQTKYEMGPIYNGVS